MAQVKKQSEKDFDVAPRNANDMQEQMRLYMLKYNTNSVLIAGDVRSVYVGETKPKMKKNPDSGNWDIPALDENDIPIMREPFRSVTIAFNGGEMQIPLGSDMFEKVQVGKRYLFEGVKGINFGEVQDIFHTITEL